MKKGLEADGLRSHPKEPQEAERSPEERQGLQGRVENRRVSLIPTSRKLTEPLKTLGIFPYLLHP